MTLCIFCSANIPSNQLNSHINKNHPTFISSKHTKNNSFLSHNMWQSTNENSHPTTNIGQVYDSDILKPLIFLDGKRIKENKKKHKRNEYGDKQGNKRRKLKQTEDICSGEEDPLGGLPYHSHLYTHIEPKFIPIHNNNLHTNIHSLLHTNMAHNQEITLPFVDNLDDFFVCGMPSKMDKFALNRLIISDLKRYNFITNASNPSPSPPQIVLNQRQKTQIMPLTLPVLHPPQSNGHYLHKNSKRKHANSHGFMDERVNASPTTSNTTSNSTNSVRSIHNEENYMQVDILNGLNALKTHGVNNSVNMGDLCRNGNYVLDIGGDINMPPCGNNGAFSLLQNFSLPKFNKNRK